jgi:hypothetical protein
MRFRLRVAVTALLGVLGVITLGSATASAAGPTLAPVMTATTLYNATVSSSAGGSTASVPAAITIVCSISVQNPHPSSHVGGTVNVIARTQCTAPVASLEMIMALARNGVIVTPPGTKTNANAGVASLQNNIAVPCHSGTYQGAAEAGIVFPPGFVPQTGIIANVSALVPITC